MHLQEWHAEQETSVIFLHGAGMTGMMWDMVAERLSQYHCIAPDLPGHGASNHLKLESLQHAASLVADVIREHGGGHAHVVGLSLGGYIGLELVATYPEVVQNLVVSGVTTRPLPMMTRMMVGVMSMVFPILRSKFVLQNQAKMMQLEGEAKDYYIHSFRQMKREVMSVIQRDVNNYTLPSALATNTLPVFAVAGEHEQELVHIGLRDMVDLIPHSQAAIVPDVHHAWAGEAPDVFATMLEGWVESQTVPNSFMAVD